MRVEHVDPDLERPAPEWRRECRDCGAVHGSGIAVPLVFFALVFVAGVVLLAVGPPLLGAIVIIGAVGGLAWTGGMLAIQQIARWLSFGR